MHAARTLTGSRSRRAGAWLATGGVVALALAVAGAAPAVEVGADLSWLPMDEDAGAVYRLSGEPRDAVDLMVENGLTVVRLRLWHSPAEPWNGLASTLEFAERAASGGCEIMLDLHYSDTWADPAHQSKPGAWESVSFEALVDSVYAYTNAVVRRFRDSGVPLAYVQIGNEISNGLLWDDGRVGGDWDTPEQWAHLCGLLGAGAAAARDSLPEDARPQIVIHVDNGADNGLCRWFYDNLAATGLDYDVIGLSFYPWWHGTMGELSANMTDISSRYGKPVMVVEAAYPWTLGWCDDTHNPVGMPEHLHDGYPATPEGQAAYLVDLLSLVESVPGGAGLIYWEPAHICIEGGPGSSWENLALFDFNGEALPSLAFAMMQATSVAPEEPVGGGHEATADDGAHPLRAEPNPLSDETVLRCAVPDGADTLAFNIYTVAGRLVRTLKEEGRTGGVARTTWDGRYPGGRHVPDGIYFCEVVVDGRRERTRLVVLR
jgi:arabinogalactan endo-1,4-beta-galactosidase